MSHLFSFGNKIFVVKLSDDNFLLWKFQVITPLEGYDLEHFLEINLKPPLKFLPAVSKQPNTTVDSLSATGGALIPNPKYKKWKRQDRLISSWLLGSMSEQILN